MPIALTSHISRTHSTMRPLLSRLHLRPPLFRAFTNSSPLPAKPLPPLPPLHDGDITESFLRGTGPGGQKINKTSSAVQLLHAPTGIVVKCQATRSRATNRAMARRLLQEKIEEQILGDGARTKVKEREKSEKKRSAAKKKRRKYRALDGEERRAEGEEEDEHEGEVAEDDRKGTTESERVEAPEKKDAEGDKIKESKPR